MALTQNPSSYPSEWLQKIELEVSNSITNGLSGAVLLLLKDSNILYQKAFGNKRKWNETSLMPTPEPMTLDTMFDLASLTKIFSTTLAFHKLVDEKTVSVTEKVMTYLPEFNRGDKKDITVQQLLQHNSGFPSDFHFYNPAQSGPEMYSQNHDLTITLLPAVPLAYTPGTKTIYSDLNFVILGAIIERLSGMKQSEYVDKYIYSPLGLSRTGYMMMNKGYAANEFAASERCGNTRDGHINFPNIRTQTIQGQVQDETAFYAMEQISGNAGLFTTAQELAVLCQLILDGGTYGKYQLCSSKTVDFFRKTFNIDKTYSLGWQLAISTDTLIYGYIPPIISTLGDTIGHTGWTGKCVLIDFHYRTAFILLTNKKHSPVVVMPNYLNTFEGDLTPAGKYGNIVDLFYRGLLLST